MSRTPELTPNPRRVAAGKANHQKRGPLTEFGREQLRSAALRNRPWEHSSGPKTPAGKAQSVRNGKSRQVGVLSVREQRAELAKARILIKSMHEMCQRIADC